MKRSVGASRLSKGPVRISLLGSTAGNNDGQARPSLRMSTSRIPLKTGRASSDHNPQSAQRQSRPTFQDPSRKTVAPRSRSSAAAAGRVSATPSGVNSVRKCAQTPHLSEQRRSQSAHSPYTPKIFGITSGKKTDPRPINDKAFQQRAMVQVYNYFIEQPATISQICPKPGTRSIMIKSFYELVAQLLGKIFPQATINGSNYVTEIPLLMKMLKYPGNLSSSWLKSANTMHSWPHVVALLLWLVEFVKSFDSSNSFLEHDTDCELLTTEELFDYNELLFDLWNDANEKACAQIEEELLSTVLMRSGVNDFKLESIQAEVDKLEAELYDPKELAAIADEQDREDQCRKAVATEKKLHETIDFKTREIKAMKEQINMERDDQSMLSNKKPIILKQLDNVKETIATQKMSKLRVDEIHEEWNAIHAELENLTKYKENIEKLAYDLNLKSTGLQVKLEKWTLDYNTNILTIGLENPEHVQLHMQVHLASALADWQEKESTFHALIQEGKNVLKTREELKHKLDNQEQEKREEYVKHQHKLQDLFTEEASLKEQRKKILAECEAQEKNLQNIIKSVEADIQDKLKSDSSPSELEAELQAAKDRANQCQQECVESQERGANFLKHYKQYCMKTLKAIHADMANKDIHFLREFNGEI